MNSPRAGVGRASLTLAVVVVIVVGAVGLWASTAPGAQSGASNSTSSQSSAVNKTVFIRVINSTSDDPIADEPVTAGPASSANDIANTPGGPTISECVHQVPNGGQVEANGTVVANGTTTTYPACPLRNYDTNSSGWVTISNQNATYFFIDAGTMVRSNAQVVALEGSQTYVTVPFPEGNFTLASSDP